MPDCVETTCPPNNSVLHVEDPFKGIMIWIHWKGAPHKVHAKLGFQWAHSEPGEILEK